MFGGNKGLKDVPRGLEKVLERLLSSPKHIAVIGSTGAGKTTFTKLLIRYAEHLGYRSIVVDWHGEYTSTPSLAYPIKVRPRLLPETLMHIVEEESRTPGYSTYLAVEKAIRDEQI